MSDCLATIDIGEKLGGCGATFRGVAGSHLTQCLLGRGLPLYQLASWSIQPFGHDRQGPKSGAVVEWVAVWAGIQSRYVTSQLG